MDRREFLQMSLVALAPLPVLMEAQPFEFSQNLLWDGEPLEKGNLALLADEIYPLANRLLLNRIEMMTAFCVDNETGRSRSEEEWANIIKFKLPPDIRTVGQMRKLLKDTYAAVMEREQWCVDNYLQWQGDPAAYFYPCGLVNIALEKYALVADHYYHNCLAVKIDSDLCTSQQALSDTPKTPTRQSSL